VAGINLEMEPHGNLAKIVQNFRIFEHYESFGNISHIRSIACPVLSEIMTTRRESPGPSEYSTSYKPGEAYWHSRMSRSPTLSDSRYEHDSPRDRVYPTVDIRQPLYTEFRNMLREHRRQEDEARDSLIKQIRDHREQQDDLLLRIAMLSSRTIGMPIASLSDSKH
jgi:hypothetical protein